jgi:hypothetical protein
MSTTNAANLFPGLPGPTARALAIEIDAATASADTLCKAGLPYPVAIEIVRQCVAGTGDVNGLIWSGINPDLAAAIKTAIDA